MLAVARRRMAFGVAAVVCVALSWVPAAATTVDQAFTYQGDAAHDGMTTTVAPPLALAWAQNLGGPSSYPVIANGRAFVTSRTNPSTNTTQLIALDLTSGQILWRSDLGGTYPWSAPAYDNGHVYALNSSGLLSEFDPATGASAWAVQLPGQYMFTSAPTAVNGDVYVSGAGSGGTVYAVDGSTGAVLWTQPVMNGDESSPAVVGGRVYVAYACQQAYAFDSTSGALIWHHATSCEGGGGKTVAVNGNSVYVRDGVLGNVILDATTGDAIGTFNAGPIPAFDATHAYLVSGGALSARDLSTGTTAWTDSGTATSAPLVAGQYVYVGTSTGLAAANGSTGQIVWSTTISGGVPAPDEQNVSQPLTGLAAASGYLLVPTATSLLAYQTPAPPPTAHFTLKPSTSSLGLKPNATAFVTVTITSANGFTGTVALSLSGVASTAKAALSTKKVYINPHQSASAHVSVSAGKVATSFTLVVHGCAGTECHTASIAVTVS